MPAGFPLWAGKQSEIYSAKALLRRQRGFYGNFRGPIETPETSYPTSKDFKPRGGTMPWISNIRHISMSFTVTQARPEAASLRQTGWRTKQRLIVLSA